LKLLLEFGASISQLFSDHHTLWPSMGDALYLLIVVTLSAIETIAKTCEKLFLQEGGHEPYLFVTEWLKVAHTTHLFYSDTKINLFSNNEFLFQ